MKLAESVVAKRANPFSANPLRAVERVRSKTGSALEDATRLQMESRFGYDFSEVRVHADAEAAGSAHAVGARAYTVGHHVVFGAGQFAPRSPSGSALLAHELAHVAQQTEADNGQALELDDPRHSIELDAVRAASSGHITQNTRPNVVHRSLFGSILGGIAGAGAGALIGGLVGGPVGAILGGLVGLVGGTAIGNAASTKERALSEDEINYAKTEIFHDTIDYSKIRITRDSMYALGAPRTIGNTIHLKSTPPWNNFEGDGLKLSEQGRSTLIHEMTHVWQYQNGGLAYIPQSVIAQLRAAIGAGGRGGAYDWAAAHKAKLPWSRWNPEQQAAAVERYNELLKAGKQKTASPDQIAELAVLTTYMRNIWNRSGAPSFGLGSDRDLLVRPIRP